MGHVSNEANIAEGVGIVVSLTPTIQPISKAIEDRTLSHKKPNLALAKNRARPLSWSQFFPSWSMSPIYIKDYLYSIHQLIKSEDLFALNIILYALFRHFSIKNQ